MGRLEELEALIVVSELGSFTAAALELGRAKSTLSKQVSQLETRLSHELLTRTTRSVTLTPAGHRLVATARGALADLQAAESSIRDGLEHVEGHLRLTTTPLLATWLVGPAVAETLRLHPELTATVSTVPDPARVDDVHADLVFGWSDLPEGRDTTEIVGTSAAWLVGSPDRELDEPPERLETSSVSVRRHAVLAGLAVARLPDFMVRADVRAGRLTRLDRDEHSPRAPIWARMPASPTALARAAAVVDTLRDLLRRRAIAKGVL